MGHFHIGVTSMAHKHKRNEDFMSRTKEEIYDELIEWKEKFGSIQAYSDKLSEYSAWVKKLEKVISNQERAITNSIDEVRKLELRISEMKKILNQVIEM